MHVLLELASAVLVIIPLYAIAKAYHETPSPRLAFAYIAFSVLEFRFLALFLIHTVVSADHYVEELLDFGGDLASMIAFAGAFLHGTRWYPGRAYADVA